MNKPCCCCARVDLALGEYVLIVVDARERLLCLRCVSFAASEAAALARAIREGVLDEAGFGDA